MSNSYYFSRQQIPNSPMELHFLRVPQARNADGGGLSLLGTICARGIDNIFSAPYPRPVMLAPRGSVLGVMSDYLQEIADWHRVKKEDVQLKTSMELANVSQTIKASHLAHLGASATLPNVPVNLGVELNFNKLETMEFSWKNASIIYLPLGNLQALYDIFEGNDRRVHPGGLLEDNFIITAALDTSDYEVRVKSSYDFSPDLVARMRELSDLGGEVKYTLRSEREVAVSVKNSSGFVTALDGVRWRDVRVGKHNR